MAKVKFTGEQLKNFNALQKNKQEQIKALYNSYNVYAEQLNKTYSDNIKKYSEDFKKNIRDKAIWGDILNYTTLGIYPIMKGIVQGISDSVIGMTQMSSQIINDVGQIFVSDGRFGNDVQGIAKEVLSDSLYAVTDDLIGIGTGAIRSALSVADVPQGILKGIGVKTDDSWFNKNLNNLSKVESNLRDTILSLGSKNNIFDINMEDAGLTSIDPTMRKEDTQLVENQNFQWHEDFVNSSAKAGMNFKNNVAPVIAQIGTLGIGKGIESLGQTNNGFNNFFNSTAESIGRMIPAIVSSTLLKNPKMASTVSKTYFFSSTFGNAFDQALQQGASLNDAYDYAYNNAIVESATEQIGGFKLGKGLPQVKNKFISFLKTGLEEGFEEIASEVTSAGLQSQIQKEDVTNADIFSRSMMSFLGGAVSGAVFGGVGNIIESKSTVGRTDTLNKEVERIYKDSDQNYVKAQNKFNNNLESLKKSYNKSSSMDLKTKQEYLANSGFASKLIRYDEKTKTFEYTKKANEMSNDLEGYLKGKQNGKTIDKDNLAISKKTDAGLVYNPNVTIATKEDINNIKNPKKVEFINQVLNNNRNIVFTKNMKGLKAMFDYSNNLIYLDYSLSSPNVLASATSHETVHKIFETNPKAYNKISRMINDSKIQKALKDKNIELLSQDEENIYRIAYSKQTSNESAINSLIKQEKVANFIEKLVTNPDVIKKMLNASPELVETLDESISKSVDNKLSKIRKSFIKYGKKASRYTKGSFKQALKEGNPYESKVVYKLDDEESFFDNVDCARDDFDIKILKENYEDSDYISKYGNKYNKILLENYTAKEVANFKRIALISNKLGANLFLNTYSMDVTIDGKTQEARGYAMFRANKLKSKIKPTISKGKMNIYIDRAFGGKRNIEGIVYENGNAYLVDKEGKKLSNVKISDFNLKNLALDIKELTPKGFVKAYQIITKNLPLLKELKAHFDKEEAKTPKVETKVETKVEAKVETKVEIKVEPKVEPKVETPKKETKVKEEAKKEVETPKVETPKVETPKVETPKVETPKKETKVKEEAKKEVETSKVEPKKEPSQEVKVEKVDKDQSQVLLEASKNQDQLRYTIPKPKEEFKFDIPTPKEEAPKEEAPKEEAPKEEEKPKEEAPKEEEKPKGVSRGEYGDFKEEDYVDFKEEDSEAIPSIRKRILQSSLKDFRDYDLKEYLKSNSQDTIAVDEIDYKSLSLSPKSRAISNLLQKIYTDNESIIRKRTNKSKLYNHLYNSILQKVMLNLSNNCDGVRIVNQEKMIFDIEEAIGSTMGYIDSTFKNNEVNKENYNNKEGYQYTKKIYQDLREFYKIENLKERDEIAKQAKGLDNIIDLEDALVNLNLKDKKSIEMLKASLGGLLVATNVAQVNSMNITGDYAFTLPNVLEQNHNHIDNIIRILGERKLVDEKGKVKKYKRESDFLKNLKLFDNHMGARLDMFAMGDITGLFMEQSLGNTLTKRIFSAQVKQLEVSNDFYDYFGKDGFLKENHKNLVNLEKELIVVNNLVDKSGNLAKMPKSQAMYLRNILLREIIRDRLIDNKIRSGSKSNKFNKGSYITIDGNFKDNLKRKSNRRDFKVVDKVKLFNELDKIISQDSFMKKYNDRIMKFFDKLYKYENIRNKDITGLVLTNDKDFIEGLTSTEKDIILKDLNIKDVSNIYVPLNTLGGNKAAGSGAFNIEGVMDFGISDGMVMGIQENLNVPLISSINIILPKYVRSVSNYYGLYRTVNDLNILFNENYLLDDGSTTTLNEKMNKLSPTIVKYYEKLLRNLSGYGIENDTTSKTFNKAMATVRRNFFKASLGLNTKVIATQFSTMFTLSSVYGEKVGSKTVFTKNMIVNMLTKGSKKKAQYLIDNSQIYKDRSRNSTFEMSEAQSEKFLKGKWDNITEFLMKGIPLTDNMINRAFFITLKESGLSNEEALRLTEKAIVKYQGGGLAIHKSELLRTENEFIRIFTKFLGEPTKVISNIESSVKKNRVINRLSGKEEAIEKALDENLKETEKNIFEKNKQYENLEKEIEKEKDEKKKKKLEKEARKVNEETNKLKDKLKNQKRDKDNFMKNIKKLISDKSKARKHLANLFVGLSASILWQTIVGVGYGLLRKGTDDKVEDENIFPYLAKKTGWQLATETIGYIPFARDMYNLIVQGYDVNTISDFQAFNGLGGVVNSIAKDLANGKDFNAGRHLKNFAIYSGQILGLPSRQIERMFTVPTRFFAKDINYTYRKATGQFVSSKEITNAVRSGNVPLIKAIVKEKLKSKNVMFTHNVENEIIRLKTKGATTYPTEVPYEFTIDGETFKNDRSKFAEVYANANFVVEKIIQSSAYSRLSDNSKAKIIKAVFSYYYGLAKQEVSGKQVYTKKRTYTMQQAYGYFMSRIPYYLNQERKEKRA